MIPLRLGRYTVVSVYILLALLLMFGSEILVWTNPVGRPILEWLLLIPGYVALSAILLDFTVRYRVRDLFGALLLTGIYTLASAIVLNPASTLNDLPRTLVTRVMGAHGLIAAEMIGLFLALTGGGKQSRRNLLIGCAIVGLAWGIWVKNWPIEEGFGAVSLPVMLAFGGGGIVLIALYLYVVLPRLQSAEPTTPTSTTLTNTSALDDSLTRLCLTRQGWLITGGVLIALLIVRLIQGEVIGAGLILCPLLLVLCWGILWFRGRKRGDTLLDHRIPIRPLALLNLVVGAALFLGVGVFAYNLPDIKLGTITPFTLIGLGFTAYGLAWLPTVSLVLGVQGYLRQLATRKM
ncbi:MAG: hypothetical protein ABI970_09440 [Chloroflexota bacterium]